MRRRTRRNTSPNSQGFPIMDVAIVGAGIGGLTAALSLHAAGINVQVYESAIEMKALGFGITLQPNAARELIELGLGDPLAQTAIETASLGYPLANPPQI